jgi:leucyl/phenylalanyl-tRNA--protein transferase
MPVYNLPDDLVFPHPSLADEDGLLAIGGDLSPDRLLLAYANGIFPWYGEGQPILWWSLNPRLVLFPNRLKVSKSMWQSIRSKKFEITFDRDFEKVIRNCAATKRPQQDGTWIGDGMIEAYIKLYELGFAHSVEATLKGQLVGGLYGVSLGRMFYGESMFANVNDASKVALYHLVEKLKTWNFLAIDAQQDTAHMRSLGAETIPLEDFLEMLNESSEFETMRGNWGEKEEE